jgi:TPR repeat protein
MRVPLTALLLVLEFAPASAQRIPICIGSPPDIYALTAKAESGESKAQLALGQYYYETKEPEKLPLSVYWFTKSAEQGDADAEWRLAGLYWAGEGVTHEDRSAVYWFERAAEDGQPHAQWALGMNYRDGLNVERDPQKAFDWFMRAAKQGDVDAQFSVAQMYEEGDLLPQDYDYVEAAKWYKKAAEQVPDWGGAGQARSSLGFLHMDGRGVR